jgi:uncharacterized protein YjbI with pentapeptide repeats
MANPGHLAKLNEGVTAWNAWREEHKDFKPDLIGADFSCTELHSANLARAILTRAQLDHADLTEANLTNADLTNADLTEANLTNADLTNADLTNAYLRGADLRSADLTKAYLTDADLTEADLTDADLTDADLTDADLTNADLTNADLTNASLADADLTNASLAGASLAGAKLRGAKLPKALFGYTGLVNLDLSVATGLEMVHHAGPSSVGIDTIFKSKGKIPEDFLRGCGVPDEFITYIPALVGAVEPIQFYSVFISYSSKDQEFAERLHADLQSKKVRCWLATEDLKIGDKFRVAIDESIRVHDKLLLVLSQHSVASEWVESEVEAAMEKERQQKRTMLFPIRLDDAVMKVEAGWPASVRRSRHIGDFQQWKDHDAYQKAFNRLTRDLKADEKKAG